VAATPTPYGALKLPYLTIPNGTFEVAATPTPYGALKLFLNSRLIRAAAGGGNANALRGTETYDGAAQHRQCHFVAATPTPYGALKPLHGIAPLMKGAVWRQRQRPTGH